ncbi:MAG: hypothetical protein ACP5O6_10640 [Candidatus Baltobacteraceae bacterium]
MSFTPRGILLALIAVLRFALGLAVWVASVVLLGLFALEFVHAPRLEATALVKLAHRLADGDIRIVSRWFGLSWPSPTRINYAPLGIAIAIWIAKGILDSILQRLDYIVRRTFKASTRSGLGVPRGEGADGALSLRRLDAESEHHRSILLKRYREIEGALKSSSRKPCTFLSIDIVGSTKMKVGERATAVAATFQAYEEMVRNTFDSYSVWKQTWTPDGVMACFLDRDLGVAAGQRVLAALAPFNRDENQLRTPIEVRCGLNDGEVVIFEDSQLEKVADHAIDVAGHMQKHADINALWLSTEVFERLENKSGFNPVEAEVDGFAVMEWKPTAEEAAAPGESDRAG